MLMMKVDHIQESHLLELVRDVPDHHSGPAFLSCHYLVEVDVIVDVSVTFLLLLFLLLFSLLLLHNLLLLFLLHPFNSFLLIHYLGFLHQLLLEFQFLLS